MTQMRQREKKALVIGVSQYDHADSLDFCRNDAEEMSKTLNSLGYKIPSSLIGRVSWSIMRDAIIDFFSDQMVRPEETLLFYYSGHGIPDIDGDVYLSTSEINPQLPDKRGFSFNELTKLIQRSISMRIVAILDCCYSGAARVSKGSSKDDPTVLGTAAMYKASKILREGEGKCILAASQGLQEAYALKEHNHSLYTYYLLQGLKGDEASVDDNGFVTPDSLSKFAYNQMMSLPLDRRPRQKPVRKVEASGDIILAYYPRFAKILRTDDDVLEQAGVRDFHMTMDTVDPIKPVAKSASTQPVTVDETVKRYFRDRKGFFDITGCAEDLGLSKSKVREIISRLGLV